LLFEKIAQAGYGDIEKRVRYERVITPADWDTRYEIYRGATFNLAHSLDQMLHLRPHNRFEDLDGMYLVGGGTHPGSGLPVIFESARITSITKILTQGGGVTGVRTDHGEELPLRAVVSNCDSVRTHRELINGDVGAKFEKRRKYEAACSGVVLYFGLKKRYDHLAHHDFVFSRDPHEEFDWIYTKGEPAPDPTCYLAATTCSEPGTAPAGGVSL
jgi:phytoene dehydrogenase-like protein